MHRKITRQSPWNLRRASDKAIPNQAPGMLGEGVETGWRASHVDEGTVRLSSKGESDRITQRSAVQIRPPQPWTPLPKCSGVHLFTACTIFCVACAALSTRPTTVPLAWKVWVRKIRQDRIKSSRDIGTQTRERQKNDMCNAGVLHTAHGLYSNAIYRRCPSSVRERWYAPPTVLFSNVTGEASGVENRYGRNS